MYIHPYCVRCTHHLPATNGCIRLGNGLSCVAADDKRLEARMPKTLGEAVGVPAGNALPGKELSANRQHDAGSALGTQVAGDHYKGMPIQPAEFIHRNKIEFLPGCVIKRMCRWRKKDGLQDLRKAIHEIELMIEMESQEAAKRDANATR